MNRNRLLLHVKLNVPVEYYSIEGCWEETATSNSIDTIKIKQRHSITCESYDEQVENKSKVGKKYPTYMTVSYKYRFLQPSKQLQLKLAVTN